MAPDRLSGANHDEEASPIGPMNPTPPRYVVPFGPVTAICRRGPPGAMTESSRNVKPRSVWFPQPCDTGTVSSR